jgi:hypothetical protein
MLHKTNFYLSGVNPDVARNRRRVAGEAPEYRGVSYASDHRRAPGIVTLLPDRPEHTRILLPLRLNLNSVTSLLLTREGLRLPDEHWVKARSAGACEMVTEAEIHRDTVHKVSSVSCRAIASDFWQNGN